MKKNKSTKKLLSVLLAVFMLLGSLVLFSFAQEEANNITWGFDEKSGTLTLSGEGAIPDYDIGDDSGLFYSLAPWGKTFPSVKKIVISEGITRVGKFAFLACANAEEIVFPSTLKEIDEGAFANCMRLKELNLPEGLETIGDMAFTYALSLEKLYIPSTVKNVSITAFAYALSYQCEGFVNMSDTAVVPTYAFMLFGNLDRNIGKAYAVSIMYELDLMLKYGDDSDNHEAELSEMYTAYINENFGTDFASDDLDGAQGLVNRYLERGNSVVPPEWLSQTCKQNSAQHEFFKTYGIAHRIVETGEVCDCSELSGTYGDNATWSIDKETRTLKINGTGALEYPKADPSIYFYLDYVNYPKYIFMNRYFDKVEIGEGITELDRYALYNLDVENVNFPASFEKFNDFSSYGDAHEFEAYTVSEGNKKYFARDGVLLENERNLTVLTSYPNSREGEYVVPEDVDVIGSHAFNRSLLSKITVNDNITEVRNAPFEWYYGDVYFYNTDAAMPENDSEIATDDFMGTLYCYPDSTISFNSQSDMSYFRCKIVIFEDKEVERIEIEKLPDKCEYIRRSGVSDKGLELRVWFKDGTSVVRKSGFRTNASNTDTTYPGTYPISVTYNTYETNRFKTNYDLVVNDVEYDDIRAGKPVTKEDIENGEHYFRFVPTCSGDYTLKWSPAKGMTVFIILYDDALDSLKYMTGDPTVDSGVITVEEGKPYYICVRTTAGLGDGENNFTLSVDCTEHFASEWIIDEDARCTVAGKQHKVCLGCGEMLETGTIREKGHNPSNWIVDKAATCTADGTQHRECLTCGETLETAKIEKTGHTPVAVPGKAATCEEDGLTEGSLCLVCNETLSQQNVISATGHTDSDDDGKCDSCGKVLRQQTIVEKIKDFFKKIMDFFKKLFG